MNLASVLLKSIIVNDDLDAWALCEKDYFPPEYKPLWQYINKYYAEHGQLPSFDAIGLNIRDESLRNRFFALKNVDDVDIEATLLVEYLKNEYTQSEIMSELETYLNDTIAFESAKENIEALQDIVLRVSSKVNILDPDEDQYKMNLLRPRDEVDRIIPIGINHEFDYTDKFGPGSYILFGGRQGSGKSITCSNIANNIYEQGSSVIYFSVEMAVREIMQRQCAISTRVPANRLESRNLSVADAEKVALWYSNIYQGGDEAFKAYLVHHDFDRLHLDLRKLEPKNTRLDIVHNPTMSISNIKMELDRRMPVIDCKAIVVDYVNQIRRTDSRNGQFDWTEQVEVSKELKTIAQEYNILVVSAYQIDNTGEARFAKGIMDAPNGAWTLSPQKHPGNLIEFKCKKRRDAPERDFISKMDWDTLKIGPESAEIPVAEEEENEDDAMNRRMREWGR